MGVPPFARVFGMLPVMLPCHVAHLPTYSVMLAMPSCQHADPVYPFLSLPPGRCLQACGCLRRQAAAMVPPSSLTMTCSPLELAAVACADPALQPAMVSDNGAWGCRPCVWVQRTSSYKRFLFAWEPGSEQAMPCVVRGHTCMPPNLDHCCAGAKVAVCEMPFAFKSGANEGGVGGT